MIRHLVCIDASVILHRCIHCFLLGNVLPISQLPGRCGVSTHHSSSVGLLVIAGEDLGSLMAGIAANNVLCALPLLLRERPLYRVSKTRVLAFCFVHPNPSGGASFEPSARLGGRGSEDAGAQLKRGATRMDAHLPL